MSLLATSWGAVLTEAAIMFCVLLGVGLGLVGMGALWSHVRR